MSDKKYIFPEEIELSEIVLNKTGHAFEMIEQEGIDYMKKTDNKSRKFFGRRAAAIAGVYVLAASSISVAAAIHYRWGRGMNGNLMASDTQQQELIRGGVAKVYHDEHDYSSMAVTDNGITVVPDTVVSDDRFVYLSFKISGFRVPDGEEPFIDVVEVSQKDVPKVNGSNLNMYGGIMYDGIIDGEDGNPACYEDGSPLESTKDGAMVKHYVDSNGDMEYIIQAGTLGMGNDSLLGKTIHVDLKNMGTVERTDFTLLKKGNWSFDISLTDVDLSKDIKVGQKVEGTGFVMEDINISPVSMEVNYSVIEAPEVKDGDLGIPEVTGVVMKDGTRIPYLTDGGRMGYNGSKAKYVAGYYRVVDVDQIAALIVRTSEKNDKVEIPISQ
ncbi:MAG: DUF4179 domain-containing protein [Lachnospiraceae bacterium]|nr:DUF4179 domain-containing protein [Lachnospiraceae bacterium]